MLSMNEQHQTPAEQTQTPPAEEVKDFDAQVDELRADAEARAKRLGGRTVTYDAYGVVMLPEEVEAARQPDSTRERVGR
jgi:hypothetical protein